MRVQDLGQATQAQLNAVLDAAYRRGYDDGLAAGQRHNEERNQEVATQLGWAAGFTPATPIEKLDLEVKTYNILKRNGIHTIGDMLTIDAIDI